MGYIVKRADYAVPSCNIQSVLENLLGKSSSATGSTVKFKLAAM